MTVPSSLALLRAAYPDTRERARAFGVWGGIAGIAAASGPVLGGALTAAVSWRAVFMVNLPVGAAALWLTRRHVTADSRRQDRDRRQGQPHDGSGTARHARRQRGAGLDPVGQVAAIAGLGGLVLALIQGGEHGGGWREPAVLAGLALFAACVAAWLLTERRVSDPMVPLGLFRRRAFSGGTAVGLLLNLGFYGQLFVLTLYLQHVRHQPASLAGVALLPEALAVLIASPLSGRLTGRIGPRLPMTAGMLLGALGFALLALAQPRTPFALLVAPMIAAGLGTSCTMPAATAAVLGAAPPDRGGVASGVLNASRQVGGAVGIALLGALVASAHQFATGMHAAMIVAAAAFAAGALLSATTVR
jgi:DHA2 family methylenomycin A resistance protein-like MFS transporter